MTPPPPLTPEQRRDALAKAAAARRRRAEVKDALKRGDLTLPDLFALSESDELVGGLKVLGMLESLPGVGKVRARRLLAELGISESRRLRGIGDQQRRRLDAHFGLPC